MMPAGRSMLAPAASGAAGLAAVVALHVRDPHGSGSYGTCPFLALTGMPCPGCGGLRAVHDLTSGDLVAALGSNAVVVVLVMGLAVVWTVWVARRAAGYRGHVVPLGTREVWCALAVVVVFAVLRTTPWGAWLAP